jgi:hypothetical protein
VCPACRRAAPDRLLIRRRMVSIAVFPVRRDGKRPPRPPPRGRYGRDPEEAMHPVIIQAIAIDQIRTMHEHAATRQRAAGCRGTTAAWSRRWLSWRGLRPFSPR